MKRTSRRLQSITWMTLAATLALGLSPLVNAADETPDLCFAQAKLLPSDQQEAFLKACLNKQGGAPPPSTVSAEQRAKVCDSIAEREHFQGEQLAAFLKGCKAG